MIPSRLRRWQQASLANALTLWASGVVLVSVGIVAMLTLAILYWTETKAHETDLRHKSQVAADSIEEPIRVVGRTLAELARSSLFTTALIDSGGRAAYARPFVQNFHFPIAARSGLALCDRNGEILAGTPDLAACQAKNPAFQKVLADGKARQILIATPAGTPLWVIFQGVTYAYTGSTEGVAVAQIAVDDLLEPLPQLLDLRQVKLQRRDETAGGAQSASTSSLALFDAARLENGIAEVRLEGREFDPGANLAPLLPGYLLAAVLLLGLTFLWARQKARRLIDPLVALRDQAHAIADSGDLSQPIPRGGQAEVGQLAESIGAMVSAIAEAQATRSAAEARYKLMFEASREAIIFAWPDGRIESANPEAVRLFGYSVDALRAQGRAGVMDTSDPRLEAALAERARTGVFRGELRCRRSDGSLIPVDIISTIFTDVGGELRSSSMFRDISDQKRAEIDLKHYQDVVASMPDAVALFDPDYRYVMVNEAYEAIMGDGRDRLIGRHIRAHVGKDAFEQHIRPSMERCLQGEPATYQNWFDFPGARRRFLSVNYFPSRDADNRINGVVAIGRDITERKQTNDALQASQALIKTVFDSLDEQVVVLDAQGVILAANAAWRRFGMENGANAEVLEGVGLNYLETCASAVSPSDVDEGRQARAGIAAVLAGTQLQYCQDYPCHSPDTQRWFHMQVIGLQGPRRGAVVIHENITERIESGKRLKVLSANLVEVQEAARRHLAGELHDRTSANLAAITVNIDAAAMALAERDWQAVAERMADNRALVEDTTASIREICAELRPPALDYAGLIAAVEAYGAQFSRRTGIDVEVNALGRDLILAPDIESTLFRIVQEALTNVAKHARASTVVIEICLTGRPLCLDVVDDGRGFDPLATPAPGLGLITMREMTEFAGGTFALESILGEGTRIHVEINLGEKQACTV